jgi:integrase
MVNKGLKDVAEAVNAIEGGERVPEGLNFYYARHTWSTLAMNTCGFDFDTVHQALNHARRGADRVTGIYVERDFTKAWEANRKVLDLLK